MRGNMKEIGTKGPSYFHQNRPWLGYLYLNTGISSVRNTHIVRAQWEEFLFPLSKEPLFHSIKLLNAYTCFLESYSRVDSFPCGDWKKDEMRLPNSKEPSQLTVRQTNILLPFETYLTTELTCWYGMDGHSLWTEKYKKEINNNYNVHTVYHVFNRLTLIKKTLIPFFNYL